MDTRIQRLAVGGLSLFITVSAIAGAVGLVGGGLALPSQWLTGTPFSSYVGPGIVLGLVVGGSALAASVLVLRGHPLAAPAAFIAGMIQVGWIAGEVLLVGTHGAVMLWLQAIYWLGGALLAVHAYGASRRDRGPTRHPEEHVSAAW